MVVIYKPIGTIHSPFKEPCDVPIQSACAIDIEGTVEISLEYSEGLTDLAGFSHVILLYHFHLSKGYSLKVRPYLDNELRGIFSTRAPARPNPIGISIVRLDKVVGEKLFIRDVDILDGTPLLDIKPYVPQYDMRATEKIGWLTHKVNKLHLARDDGRFYGTHNIFDILTEKYDAWYNSIDGLPLYESELKCIRSIIPKSTLPILEVGVGTGRFAMHFQDIIGVDPALNALKMAHVRGIIVVQAYGENLPFKDETFGSILIIVTLCFVDNPLEVLKEAERVLRTDGSIILGLVPQDSPWGAYYEDKKSKGHPFYRSARFYTLENVRGLLENSGLEISRIKSTLFQRPDESRRIEEPVEGHIVGAGFLCVEAKKGI